MADEPLPLPVYARAIAHLLSHRDQPIENVLGALGLTMAELAAADEHYSQQLRGAYRRRRGILAMTFAEAFAEARVGLGLIGGARPVPAPPPAAPESHALPSYMSGPAGSAPAASMPVSRAPAPAGPVASMPVAPVPAMPAQVPPASMPVAPVPAMPAQVPPASVPVAPTPPAPVSAGVPRGTADLQIPKVLPQPLPFQPGAAGAAPQFVSQPAPPASQPGPGTGTVFAPADAPRAAELPWDAAQVRERVGKLTLAHFAALTIEVGRNPPDLAPVLRRYGLSTPEDLRHVSAAFHAQMSVDAGMKAQFEALLARMRSMSARG